MIDLSHEVPQLRLGNGVIPLEIRWLEESLEHAARAAGYPHWLPAEHVARTINAFLLHEAAPDPLSVESFALTVRSVLEGIGYGEVAPFFLRGGIELGFSLLDVSDRAQAGFELGFFYECERALDRLLACEVLGKIFFQDIIPAVKAVLNRSHWCSRCDQLRDEVVCFIRFQLARRGRPATLAFSIH